MVKRKKSTNGIALVYYMLAVRNSPAGIDVRKTLAWGSGSAN